MPKRSAPLLGAGVSGGRRRCVKVLKARLGKFQTRIKRFQQARKAGICAKQLVRVAGEASVGGWNSRYVFGRRIIHMVRSGRMTGSASDRYRLIGMFGHCERMRAREKSLGYFVVAHGAIFSCRRLSGESRSCQGQQQQYGEQASGHRMKLHLSESPYRRAVKSSIVARSSL